MTRIIIRNTLERKLKYVHLFLIKNILQKYFYYELYYRKKKIKYLIEISLLYNS